METIASRVDATSTAYRREPGGPTGAGRRAEGTARHRRAGRAGEVPGTPRGARQAPAARAHRPAARRRQPLPGDRPAGRGRHVRRRLARCRRHCRDRAGARPPGAGHFQRRHGQGRHLLSDDGEEAPPGAGNRAGEPAALHLPRGLRRRVPAQAGRGLPGQGTLRPDLLQPGKDVRGEDPADRLRDGLLHRRRRVRSGDERRDRDCPQPGHHLPGRPAAGEGRDRRDRHGGGTRRRRRALEDLRGHGPPGRER